MVFASTHFTFAQTRTRWENAPEIERRVEALLKQMSLEEKIGQLNQYSYGQPTGPATGRSAVEEAIRRGEIGSFLNVTDPVLSNRLQRLAMEQSRLKIPLIFGLDVIHGYRTIFPCATCSVLDLGRKPGRARLTYCGARSNFSRHPLDFLSDGRHSA